MEIEGELNARSLASALSLVVAFKADGDAIRHGWERLEPDEALAALPGYPGLRRSVQITLSMPRGLGITRTIAAAAHYLFCEKDAQAADDFIQKLRTGQGLVAGDPILDLRERMLNRQARTTVHESHVFGLVLKAWEKYRAGRVRTTSKAAVSLRSNEPFPTVAD